ncbi:MAG: hypothetical protein ND807_05905 [Vicinamibacterales bacterium]|nr:hypothetical protein [Vicinamibacterales bacterium]
MAGRLGTRRALDAAFPAVVFYALVVLLAPGLHHDFACHQNLRTHCTSCVTSQTAPNVDVCPPAVNAMAGIAGHIELRSSVLLQSPALFSDSGRSPPARD